MKQQLLERLRCPQSSQPLAVECADSAEIIEGYLVSQFSKMYAKRLMSQEGVVLWRL